MYFTHSIVYFVAYSVHLSPTGRQATDAASKNIAPCRPTTVRKTNRSTTLSCEWVVS